MWLRLRNTDRRGRSVVPANLTRTRRCRLARAFLRSNVFNTGLLGSLAGLAGLAADALAAVHHALALVRLGRTQLAQLGRDLADVFLGDPGHREVRGIGDVDADALARRVAH